MSSPSLAGALSGCSALPSVCGGGGGLLGCTVVKAEACGDVCVRVGGGGGGGSSEAADATLGVGVKIVGGDDDRGGGG